MTQKELIERNIGLTFDFVNHLIDNKLELEKIPDNFKLEFLEKDFPKKQSLQVEKKTSTPIRKQYVRVQNAFATV
jgi:hypothetical protein